MKNHQDHGMASCVQDGASFKRSPLVAPALAGSRRDVPEVALVYLADRTEAAVGETVRFTAWLLNATDETLTDISLLPRSLTNGRLDHLAYATTPTAAELSGRTLGPRQCLSFTLTYKPTSTDALDDGLIISALQAELSSPRYGRMRSECDAMATVHN
ncbi:hypothetical protein ACT3TS_11115 [Specibacter sp. AOP5-B1-6]|uniref:hypothetical protein n=1 Tax=Specibacter sp. AOP5-B1-6 TaxID=3457653 RepID=UPI00402BC674